MEREDYIKPDIEILICTHNRVELLRKTLDSINQAKRPDNCLIQVCVAANACDDSTLFFLKEYVNEQFRDRALLPLIWFEEPKLGKSNALNSAIRHLSSSIVAFVDDDHRIEENFFWQILEVFKRYPDIDFFCGKILPDWTGTEPDWVLDEGEYKIFPLPIPKFDIGNSVQEILKGGAVPGGGNLIIKSEIFAKVGLFSMNLGPKGHNLEGSEDYDWVVRALSKGFRLMYNPGIKQYHYVNMERLKLKYLFKKSLLRTKTVTMLKENEKGIPLYVIKKMMIYSFNSIISLRVPDKRRFYLIRLAASIGEFLGHFEVTRNLKNY